MKKLYFLLICFFVSGCSTTIPINYIPSSVIKGDKDISLENFVYLPAQNGKVKENEMQRASGAIGKVYTTKGIAEIIKSAFRKELVASGFTVVSPANITIDVDVDKFLYDWLGFTEVDFYINLTFKVYQNQKEIMVYSVKSHQASPKTVSMTMDNEAIRTALSGAFDEFLIEARNRRIL